MSKNKRQLLAQSIDESDKMREKAKQIEEPKDVEKKIQENKDTDIQMDVPTDSHTDKNIDIDTDIQTDVSTAKINEPNEQTEAQDNNTNTRRNKKKIRKNENIIDLYANPKQIDNIERQRTGFAIRKDVYDKLVYVHRMFQIRGVKRSNGQLPTLTDLVEEALDIYLDKLYKELRTIDPANPFE
jgi:hypothetical protein